jgi:hypothetical protein
LFGDPEESTFSMDETRVDDIPQVFDEENYLLTNPYSEEGSKEDSFPDGTQ